MNHSGDAAEQIVRMSWEGVEVAVRITDTAYLYIFRNMDKKEYEMV